MLVRSGEKIGEKIKLMLGKMVRNMKVCCRWDNFENVRFRLSQMRKL